jgi:hypothetical protein
LELLSNNLDHIECRPQIDATPGKEILPWLQLRMRCTQLLPKRLGQYAHGVHPHHTDTSNRRFFRIFDLSGELRNGIYELLTAESNEIDVFQPLPFITEVSRQIPNESLVVYLDRNRLCVGRVPENIDYLIHRLGNRGCGTTSIYETAVIRIATASILSYRQTTRSVNLLSCEV